MVECLNGIDGRSEDEENNHDEPESIPKTTKTDPLCLLFLLILRKKPKLSNDFIIKQDKNGLKVIGKYGA